MIEPCKTCVYSVKVGGYIVCDFLERTGTARILICPPGKKCTVRKTTPQNVLPRFDLAGYKVRDRTKKKIDVQAVRKMAQKGMSDRQIGEKFGATRNAIQKFRKRHGIEAGIPCVRGRRNGGAYD